jgi:hypothetical protein
MMTIKYGLQFLFFELTDNDGVTGACRCNEITNLTMGNIEDLGSAILVNVQDTESYKSRYSPFSESFTWKFAKRTSDNLDSVVHFANIMETSGTNNITREVRNTGALKFENCNEFMSDFFFVIRLKIK